MGKAFYYKDQLVRKSENHEYQYAVVRLTEVDTIISVMGCRADLGEAQKLLRECQKRWDYKREFHLVELTEGVKK